MVLAEGHYTDSVNEEADHTDYDFVIILSFGSIAVLAGIVACYACGAYCHNSNSVPGLK